MAQTFPEHIPAAWRRDPRLAAERRVVEALRTQLSDEYSVLWRVPLYDDEAARGQDAEADIVVLHASHGLLVLEVKGGAVERNERGWVSTDRNRKRHRIKNPFEQAVRCKHILVRQLRTLPALRSRRLAACHAVALPDSERPRDRDRLGPEAPFTITAFADTTATLGLFVADVMQRGDADTGFGIDGLHAAIAALAPRFRLAHPLKTMLSADEAELIELTEAQFDVLDTVGREPRLLVTGGAGTGKTMLAAELARRLAERGVRTLLTTSGHTLAAWLATRFPGDYPELLVSALDAIDEQLLRQAADRDLLRPETIATLHSRRSDTDMIDRWLNVVVEAPALRFDAVIVDEAQDLLADEWAALNLCLKDPAEGPMYAFCDEGQLDPNVEFTNLPAEPPYRLSPLQSRLPGDRFVEVTLVENLRNTQRIFALARPLYRVAVSPGGDYRCRGPLGENVELIEAHDWQAVREMLAALLTRLVGTQQISPRDIAVLYFTRFAKHGGLRLPWQDPDDPNVRYDPSDADLGWLSLALDEATVAELVVRDARKFRGMESPVVILAGSPRDDRDAYIGLTRARVYLAVIGTADELATWSVPTGALSDLHPGLSCPSR